jgi:hypothetical protein
MRVSANTRPERWTLARFPGFRQKPWRSWRISGTALPARRNPEEVDMQTNLEQPAKKSREARLDCRLNDIGWGLLLMLTGAVWLLPAADVPPGTWLFGVAAILLGINVARYLEHIAVSGFSIALGVAALVAALSQVWRTDPPLVAVFLLVMGFSLILKPLLTRTA